MRLSSVVFLVTLTASLALAGFAFAKGPVKGEVQAFIVSVNDDGSEVVRTADEAVPGEVMEFQIIFTNEGDQSVTGIQVVDSIPENTRFISDSHDSDVQASFDVSIDGGKSYETVPVLRIETQPDGTQLEVEIPAEQYTHVRWRASEPLESDGGQHRFSYRVSID
ncbi:MAG: hypothetical protein AB8B87_13105 [Granulosicoccus sp.]